MIDGNNLERACKNHLSGFRSWTQLNHASEWMLLEHNCGVRLSIDETLLCDDLFTILSNKDGHGRQGGIVAMVRGTKSVDVIKILLRIPQVQRLAVEEGSDGLLRQHGRHSQGCVP